MPVIESFYAFLDVESTGVKPGWDEPSEIATILTDRKLREVSRFEAKIKMQHPERMTADAAAINGYDAAVWAREQVLPKKWFDWLEIHIPRPHVAIAVGYNAAFDRDIIWKAWCEPTDFLKLAYRPVDMISFSRMLDIAGVIQVPDLKLATVMKALGFGEQTHKAMADCEAVLRFFQMMVDLTKKCFSQVTLPPQVGKLGKGPMPQLMVPAGHVGTPGSHMPIERLSRKDAPPQLDLKFPTAKKTTGTDSFL